MKQENEVQNGGYRIGKITILEIMGVLAVTGLLLTWVLHRFIA